MTNRRLRTFWGDRKPPENRAAMFRVDLPKDAATQKVTGSTATIRVYGPIDSWGGFWGVSAKDVATVLDDLDDSVNTIQVRLNSPGGDAFEGVAIMNLLRAHSARTIAVVDGLAASAASVIAAGCDELVMSPGSELMIHEASTFAYGDSAEMDKAHRMLESVSNTLASVYAAKAGGNAEDWRALMVAETWYGADEAVESGLADRTETVPDSGPTETAGEDPEPVVIEEIIEDAFDLSIFTYAGRSHAPAPANLGGSPTQTPAAAPAGGKPEEGSKIVAFSDDSIAALRQKLGLADNADESTILAAVDEALEERAEPQNRAPQLPEGVVTIDAAQLDELRASAEAGRQARAQQEQESRERLVQNAISEGKIAPARREAWLNRLKADPAEAETLNSLESGLIPVKEIGNGQADADQTESVFTEDEDAALASMTGLPKGVFRR